MSLVELQDYRERQKWFPIALDRIRFNGSAAVVGGRFRILVNGREVFQNGHDDPLDIIGGRMNSAIPWHR